jgi:hypothetical protein
MFTRTAVLVAATGGIALLAFAQGSTGALSMPLKGLTKDNLATVETTLSKLERSGWRCQTCDYFAKAEGECPGCNTALVEEKSLGPLLRDVKVDAAKHLAMFGVSTAQGIRLTELEAGLKGAGVEIDRTKLAIVPFSRLTIDGIDTEEAGKTLEKTLAAAKLYENIKIDVNTEHKQAIVIAGPAKAAPTLGTIEAAIEKAGPFRVTEIAWAAPCAKCAEKGMKHAGCLSCWEKKM